MLLEPVDDNDERKPVASESVCDLPLRIATRRKPCRR
jgi:hypothetical protein